MVAVFALLGVALGVGAAAVDWSGSDDRACDFVLAVDHLRFTGTATALDAAGGWVELAVTDAPAGRPGPGTTARVTTPDGDAGALAVGEAYRVEATAYENRPDVWAASTRATFADPARPCSRYRAASITFADGAPIESRWATAGRWLGRQGPRVVLAMAVAALLGTGVVARTRRRASARHLQPASVPGP